MRRQKINQKNIWHQLFYATVFAIAMAFLESAIVIYLRALYYPEGFSFPLIPIDGVIAFTELGREAATMIMLVFVALMLAKRSITRFAYFIYCFAVWDIFYYIFLKVILGWPDSFFTWDVLFLLPFTWVGPVIAPIINSLLMITLATVLIYLSRNIRKVKTGWVFWTLLIFGSVIVIAAYTEEYVRFMNNRFSLLQLFDISMYKSLQDFATDFIPIRFLWWLFSIGIGMHLIAIGLLIKNNYRHSNK